MTTIDIPAAASPFEAIKQINGISAEFWSVRDLQPLLGYDRWERMPEVLDRARAACRNSGLNEADHFRPSSKMVVIGSGTRRAVADFHLTRYGSYLLAMNGDPRKPQVAAAQTYFAVKTHEAEKGVAGVNAPAPTDVAAIGRRELALMVIEAEDRATAAEQRLAAQAPAVEAWESYLSADGDMSVADTAKALSRHPIIQLGGTRLFGHLERMGWIYRGGDSRLHPYQRCVDAGWLAELAMTKTDPDTGVTTTFTPQIRVTPKGFGLLFKRLAAGTQLDITAASDAA